MTPEEAAVKQAMKENWSMVEAYRRDRYRGFLDALINEVVRCLHGNGDNKAAVALLRKKLGK